MTRGGQKTRSESRAHQPCRTSNGGKDPRLRCGVTHRWGLGQRRGTRWRSERVSSSDSRGTQRRQGRRLPRQGGKVLGVKLDGSPRWEQAVTFDARRWFFDNVSFANGAVWVRNGSDELVSIDARRARLRPPLPARAAGFGKEAKVLASTASVLAIAPVIPSATSPCVSCGASATAQRPLLCAATPEPRSSCGRAGRLVWASARRVPYGLAAPLGLASIAAAASGVSGTPMTRTQATGTRQSRRRARSRPSRLAEHQGAALRAILGLRKGVRPRCHPSRGAGNSPGRSTADDSLPDESHRCPAPGGRRRGNAGACGCAPGTCR